MNKGYSLKVPHFLTEENMYLCINNYGEHVHMNKSIRITAIIIRVTGAVGLDGFLIGFVFYTNSVWDGSVCD